MIDEWNDDQQERLDFFTEEIDLVDEKLKKELRVLDHYRRDLKARYEKFADDPMRIPKHTGKDLLNCANQAKEAQKRSKDLTNQLGELGKAFEREMEAQDRVRRRYEPNFRRR